MPKRSPASTLRSQMGPFAIVPIWVLERCQYSPAIHLYGILAKHANREGRAWPSRAHLTSALGTSSSTLDRAIAALKKIHALEVRLRHRADGAVVGADYLLMQAQPDADLFVTDDEKADTDHSVTTDEKATPPFHQKQAAISSPVTIVLKEEPDPVQPDPKAESTALPQSGSVFTGHLDPGDADEAFVLAWNAAVAGTGLKAVQSMTPKRRRLIRARRVERAPEAWRAVMRRIATSSFCCGAKGWLASLDWLIAQPDAGVKAEEGQFDDHVSEADLQAAKTWRFRVSSTPDYCPHDPLCDDDASCLRRIALRLRSDQRRAS